MRILMDVDGVCADFVGALVCEVPTLRREQFTKWCIREPLGPSFDRIKMDCLDNAGWWARMKPIPGAKEVVLELREQGHDVIFVTAPYIDCYGMESRRRKWLVDNMDAKPENIIFAIRKEIIDGDVFIDDKAQNIHDWADHWGKTDKALLFTAIYNINYPWPYRCSWDGEKSPAVLDLLNARKEVR